MDEPIWMYVGIISVIIGLGIVVNLFGQLNESKQKDKIIWALDKIETNYNFVCGLPKDTRIVVELEFPSGIVLNGTNNRICITADEEDRCKTLDCNMTDPYILDLDTVLAKKTFNFKEYACYLEKEAKNVTLECQG